MKKYLVLFITAITLSTFVACDSDDDFTPPNYLTFASESLDLAVDQNSSGSIDVTVYTANTTGSDRTFTIDVDTSSTLNSESFSVPETVTIPANTNESTFTVDITDNGIEDSGNTLVLYFSEGQGVYTGEPVVINVSKICEFESLAPGYSGTRSAFGVEAPQFETTLNDEGDMVFTSDDLWGSNFIAWATEDDSYAGLFPYPATITMDADNNLTVTSEAEYMTGGEGTYNPCTGTFNFSIETTIFGDPETVDIVLTPNDGAGDNGGGDTDSDESDSDE